MSMVDFTETAVSELNSHSAFFFFFFFFSGY